MSTYSAVISKTEKSYVHEAWVMGYLIIFFSKPDYSLIPLLTSHKYKPFTSTPDLQLGDGKSRSECSNHKNILHTQPFMG
jgi:hypothetical protein